MRISSPAPTAAYDAFLDEAFKQSPVLIGRWCTRLLDALLERSMRVTESAEKHQLYDAIASLKKNQSALEQGFVAALAHAIAEDARSVAAKKVDPPGRSLSTLSFDDLELMGDSQIQEKIDNTRLLQIVSISCEAGLAGLAARLSTAQGFSVVKADKNPLRPEVVSQALLKLLQDLPADKLARSRWLLYGAQLMGQELQTLYVLLNEQLAAQGVAPAAYGVTPSREDKPARAGGSLNAAGGTANRATPAAGPGFGFDSYAGFAASPGISRANDHLDSGTDDSARALLTLDHLHHLLVGDYDESFKDRLLPSGFKPAAHRGFSHTVPAALDVLVELKEKGLATGRGKTEPVTLPLAQMRAQLKTEAKSLGQSLAIEVVGLMIEQIVLDPRLLEPVRRIIADVEPAYLRLSVSDPRFFSDKSHPARRLLEVITAKSLAYSSEKAAGFAEFMEDLRDVAWLLTEEHAGDALHFASLLKTFENSQALRGADNQALQSRAVQTLLQAEQRNLLAEKVAAEICARPDFIAGNRIVTAFLTGPWAQVIARERLLDAHEAFGSKKAEFSLTLGDMLWSLDPAQTSRHRKRLVKIIPDMLEGIRSGLLSIDYPLAQSKAFFDEFMQLHQTALRAESVPLPIDPKVQNRLDLEDVFAAGEGSYRTKPWLAPSEAQHSGFMQDLEGLQSQHSLPRFEATEPQLRDAEAGSASLSTDVDGISLDLGAWVELFSEDRWLRAQLTWISPYNTLYMFTSAGGRTHSMTGPLLQYLLLQQLVRVVSLQGVLDGALDTVARTAMRNSMGSKSQL